jgi:hypothetical protein
VAQRWILAALRNRTFFSLAEANAAIRERLTWLNDRPFRKLEGTRRSVFESIDAPALKALPSRPYEFGTWKRAKVSIDYHLEVDRHYYSVPYQLVGERAEVRISAGTIEIFVRGRRVASHVRSHLVGRHSTVEAHMPPAHRAHREWTPGRIVAWGEQAGPSTGAFVSAISRVGSIPSKVSARVWASCAWAIAMAPRAWKPPVSAHSLPVRSDTAASTRS